MMKKEKQKINLEILEKFCEHKLSRMGLCMSFSRHKLLQIWPKYTKFAKVSVLRISTAEMNKQK